MVKSLFINTESDSVIHSEWNTWSMVLRFLGFGCSNVRTRRCDAMDGVAGSNTTSPRCLCVINLTPSSRKGASPVSNTHKIAPRLQLSTRSSWKNSLSISGALYAYPSYIYPKWPVNGWPCLIAWEYWRPRKIILLLSSNYRCRKEWDGLSSTKYTILNALHVNVPLNQSESWKTIDFDGLVHYHGTALLFALFVERSFGHAFLYNSAAAQCIQKGLMPYQLTSLRRKWNRCYHRSHWLWSFQRTCDPILMLEPPIELTRPSKMYFRSNVAKVLVARVTTIKINPSNDLFVVWVMMRW